MDRYAQIQNGVVVNVIESETDPDGVNGEWVACGPACPGWLYSNETGEFSPPPPAPPAPGPVWEWYIDIGPFTDRLGLASAAIDLSTEPGVVVIRNDLARRKWIDLKDQRVIAALWYLAGQAHPVLGTLVTPLLTASVVTSALSTPVAAEENLALRKLYFS